MISISSSEYGSLAHLSAGMSANSNVAPGEIAFLSPVAAESAAGAAF